MGPIPPACPDRHPGQSRGGSTEAGCRKVQRRPLRRHRRTPEAGCACPAERRRKRRSPAPADGQSSAPRRTGVRPAMPDPRRTEPRSPACPPQSAPWGRGGRPGGDSGWSPGGRSP